MLFGLFTPGPWEMVILGVVFVLLFPGLLRRLCRGLADSVNIIRATFDRGDAYVAIEDPYLAPPESIWPTAFRSADTSAKGSSPAASETLPSTAMPAKRSADTPPVRRPHPCACHVDGHAGQAIG